MQNIKRQIYHSIIYLAQMYFSRYKKSQYTNIVGKSPERVGIIMCIIYILWFVFKLILILKHFTYVI